jgi:hypothetical protein
MVWQLFDTVWGKYVGFMCREYMKKVRAGGTSDMLTASECSVLLTVV